MLPVMAGLEKSKLWFDEVGNQEFNINIIYSTSLNYWLKSNLLVSSECEK